MCTFVILRRPDHSWPVIIGANRDEMVDRPSTPPGRHWPERPGTIAGRDDLAGGSWLGLNDDGVVAGIMNRLNTLGPEAGKRSRGELVLEALDHADARDAVTALAELDGRAYRPFNMVVADNRDAFWLRHSGRNSSIVEIRPLHDGLSMITAHDRNDIERSERIRAFLPRFDAAPPPQPDKGDWEAWAALMASRGTDEAAGAGMTVRLDGGFGTRSSSLMALPAIGADLPVWRFSDGPPDANPYRDVTLR
ncbi:MAG: NRDE family protein [Rhodospirillaceae bacterium]|nr:NRDE family protein [Rhodospirillaceae bacterium]